MLATNEASPPHPGLTAHSARPPRGLSRFFITYVVTFRVVLSYVSLRIQGRFRSHQAIETLARRKHVRNARRMHDAIVRLQGLYIKVGQLVSIMANFLPEEFRNELAGLQDQVPARSYREIEPRLREELGGRAPSELFADFEETAIAAASIGQVHRARLRSGERVAVKVQYPEIDEIVRIDLRTLERIFRVVEYFIPHEGMDDVYREIRAMVLQELDFRTEADNVMRIASRFAGRTDIGFPRVIPEFSSARVLTTEWIDGVKASDRARLDQLGIDKAKLARQVVTAYCQQIFTDGLYHADPHPGNLLVRKLPDGTVSVVFIDFGAVAEMSPKMRRGIADFIRAALVRDTPKLVQAMKDMGFIARAADPAIFDEVVDFLHQRFQEDIQVESFSLKDVKFDPQKSLRNLADLRRMGSLRDIAGQFHVPKDWILFERTVLLLLGLCTELDPTLNPMEVIQPYLEEFVLGKDRDWSTLVLDTSKDLAASVLALPSDIKKFLHRANRGELELRVRGLDHHAQVLYELGHQMITTAIGIAAASFALTFEERGRHELARAAWITAGVCAAVLVLSVLVTRPRLRRK